MMGGNTRQQALAAVDWHFSKDAISIEIEADPRMNQYRGESHTLLLGIYQMADAASFYQLIADPAAFSKQLGSGESGEGFVQFIRYVVAPGQHSILLLDRAQKTRFIGIAAGYYALNPKNSVRLFEIPLSVQSKGWVSATYTAAPATLALHLNLGPDGIINAQQSKYDPAIEQKQEAVLLDGGGKEIKLGANVIDRANQRSNNALQKLGN